VRSFSLEEGERPIRMGHVKRIQYTDEEVSLLERETRSEVNLIGEVMLFAHCFSTAE